MNAVSGLARFALVAALLAMGGCATVSKGECQTGDWYGIGVRDGANGYGEERFLENSKACAKHGIAADRERWLDGRMRGLERYCTTRNGLAVGENGSNYRGVCPVETEGDFMMGYELGRDLHDARGRLSSLSAEIDDLTGRLERDREARSEEDRKKYGLTDSERVDFAYRLGVAVVRREEAQRVVWQLENEARDL